MWKLPELPWDLSWVSWREGEGGESGDAVEGRNAHVPVVHVATADIGTRLFNGCEEGAVTNPMHKRRVMPSATRVSGIKKKQIEWSPTAASVRGLMTSTAPTTSSTETKEATLGGVETPEAAARDLTSSRKRGARKGRGKRGGQESGKGTSSTSHPSSTRMVSHSSSAHVQLESQVGVPE